LNGHHFLQHKKINYENITETIQKRNRQRDEVRRETLKRRKIDVYVFETPLVLESIITPPA